MSDITTEPAKVTKMNGSEAAEYQQETDELEHQMAECEQHNIFYTDDICIPVKDICNCSRCRDLRRAEAQRMG